jgi:hypothetical protein
MFKLHTKSPDFKGDFFMPKRIAIALKSNAGILPLVD